MTIGELEKLPEQERSLWFDSFNRELPGTYYADTILFLNRLNFLRNSDSEIESTPPNYHWWRKD